MGIIPPLISGLAKPPALAGSKNQSLQHYSSPEQASVHTVPVVPPVLPVLNLVILCGITIVNSPSVDFKPT